MAAHGTGAFENDNAADLILGIYEDGSWSSGIAAIRENLNQDGDLLDSMNAEFAIAAIALALAKVNKLEFGTFERQCEQIGIAGDDPVRFLKRLPLPPNEIFTEAKLILEQISDPDNALNFSWSETDYYQSWLNEIKYLKGLISE